MSTVRFNSISDNSINISALINLAILVQSKKCRIKYGLSIDFFFQISARSRTTFTTGVTSSPPRNSSKTLNGATKETQQKPGFEMKHIYPVPDGDTSPKETCVSMSDVKETEFLT